ncbi:MAG: hypothetical protein O7D91_04935 [Planctomycetota bacterium]|nr:hypothetical protein [Planctomycetota bacterium]
MNYRKLEDMSTLSGKEDPFGEHNPADWRGDCYLGRNAGIPKFPVYLQADDFDNAVLEISGAPNMGKTRLERRIICFLLSICFKLVVIETQKFENADLATLPAFLYFDDETFRFNPCEVREPGTPQKQALLIANRMADIFGMFHGAGGTIVRANVAYRLSQYLRRSITEIELRDELKRMLSWRGLSSDQRNVLARLIERSDQLVSQIGHIINTQDNYLFEGLDRGKNILLDFTRIEGEPRTYLTHSAIKACHQYQEYKSAQDHTYPQHSKIAVFVDEANDTFAKENHGSFSMLSYQLESMRSAGMVIVLCTQEPSRLSPSVAAAASVKACFRLNSGIDTGYSARCLSLDKAQHAALSTLPQQQCVVAVGRNKPLVIEVADTPIDQLTARAKREFLPQKREYSVQFVGGSTAQESPKFPSTEIPKPESDGRPLLSPDASRVLEALAENEDWCGREQLTGKVALSHNRFSAALTELQEIGLITNLKVRLANTGRPRTIDYPSIKGWQCLGRDSRKSRLHTVVAEKERRRLSSHGLRTSIEVRNGDIRHDVAARDRNGQLLAVSEIVLSMHRSRVKKQIAAAVSAGVRTIYLVCCDGPDAKVVQRLIATLPAEQRDAIEIVPVRELIVSQNDGKQGANH